MLRRVFSSRVSQFAMQGSSAAIATLILASSLMAQAATPSGDVTVPTESVPSGSTSSPSSSGSSTTPSSTTPSGTPSTNVPLTGVRFACQPNNGQPTVMYLPESQPNKAFPWAVPSNMGGGWDANRRCVEIARRLESYRPDGLTEMMTAKENGYNTICVTTEKVPTCRIVLTVPNGQDPVATRDRVFQNLSIADSGQMTQGVNAYTSKRGGSTLLNQIGQAIGLPSGLGDLVKGGASLSPSSSQGINLKPFLDQADGGTGERLSGGVAFQRGVAQPTSPSRKLNPNLFR